EVTPESLRAAGLVKRAGDKIKVLGDGELTKPLTVRANAFSKTAEQKILAAGGKAEVI
ncbi:MAG: uL15 family ribosomal protein, partial [Desulfofundulus sp.]